MRIADKHKGIFPIGVVADIIGVSQKQLRLYEAKGIIEPSRSEGNHRLYSMRDVELLTYIHYLASVRKVNLAGIKVILELLYGLPRQKQEKLIKSVETKIDQLKGTEKRDFEKREGDIPDQPTGNVVQIEAQTSST